MKSKTKQKTKSKINSKTKSNIAKFSLGAVGLLSLYALYKSQTNKANNNKINDNKPQNNQANNNKIANNNDLEVPILISKSNNYIQDKNYCLDIMPMNDRNFNPVFKDDKRILKANVKINMSKKTYEIITKNDKKFCGNFNIHSINDNTTEIFITSKKFSDYLATLKNGINIESNKLLLSIPTSPILLTNSRNNISRLLSLILTLKKGKCNY